MELLKNIQNHNLLSIDIETVRISENYSDLPEDYQSAWEYKNKQDGEIPDFDTLSEKWEKTSSLYAEFSKVCAVSVALLSSDKTTLVCKELFGDSEEQILKDLANFLDKANTIPENRLVAHAGKFFDYPFLCKRYIINGMDIPKMLDTAHQKPWESKNLCSNTDIWKMGGTGAGSSLQALCTALKVPVSKVDMVGDQVGKEYFKGKYEEIGRYCSYDAVALFNVLMRIKKQPIFQFDEVKYISPKRIDLIDSIKESGSVSPENLLLLVERAKTMKKQEKDALVDIVKAALQTDQFDESDLVMFEAIKKAKK